MLKFVFQFALKFLPIAPTITYFCLASEKIVELQNFSKISEIVSQQLSKLNLFQFINAFIILLYANDLMLHVDALDTNIL